MINLYYEGGCTKGLEIRKDSKTGDIVPKIEGGLEYYQEKFEKPLLIKTLAFYKNWIKQNSHLETN